MDKSGRDVIRRHRWDGTGMGRLWDTLRTASQGSMGLGWDQDGMGWDGTGMGQELGL